MLGKSKLSFKDRLALNDFAHVLQVSKNVGVLMKYGKIAWERRVLLDENFEQRKRIKTIDGRHEYENATGRNDSSVEVCGCAAPPEVGHSCQYWCRRAEVATLDPRGGMLAAMLDDRCYGALTAFHAGAATIMTRWPDMMLRIVVVFEIILLRFLYG